MRATITLSLPKEMKRDLDRACADEGLSRSDLVRASLRDYLYVRRFRGLRARMVAKAQSRGIHTDEDVFDKVS